MTTKVLIVCPDNSVHNALVYVESQETGGVWSRVSGEPIVVPPGEQAEPLYITKATRIVVEEEAREHAEPKGGQVMSKREMRDKVNTLPVADTPSIPGYDLATCGASGADVRRGYIKEGEADEHEATIFGPAPDDPETIPHRKYPMYKREQRYSAMPLGGKDPKFMDDDRLHGPEKINEGLIKNGDFGTRGSRGGGAIGGRDSGVSSGGGKIVDAGNYERDMQTGPVKGRVASKRADGDMEGLRGESRGRGMS